MDSSKVDSSIVIIPDVLLFVSVKPGFVCPPNTAAHTYFCTDETLIYTAFFADFGPLNLGLVHTFCRQLHELISQAESSKKLVVYYCSSHPHRRANSAVLLCAYMIFILNYSAERAYAPFVGIDPPLYPFRDAGFCINTFPITVLDCARGMRRAVARGHYVHNEFDLAAYQKLSKLQFGDISWVIPGKFIAFSGPVAKKRMISEGVWTLSPAEYVPVLKDLNVTCIVRFNSKCYDRAVFTSAGIRHVDLYYEDGGNPTDAILQAFLQLCEHERGAIAVHCKAGLGRTGTNIAAYMIKHYGYSAREATAWHRICRPGSIVGPQQHYLCTKEDQLRNEGQTYRLRHNIRETPEILPHSFNRETGAATPPLSATGREATGGSSSASNLFKPLFRKNSNNSMGSATLGNSNTTNSTQAPSTMAGSMSGYAREKEKSRESTNGQGASIYTDGSVRRPNTSGGILQHVANGAEQEKPKSSLRDSNDQLSQSLSNMRLKSAETHSAGSRPSSGTGRRVSVDDKKSRKFAFSDSSNNGSSNGAVMTGGGIASGGPRSGGLQQREAAAMVRSSVDGALRASNDSTGRPSTANVGIFVDDATSRPHTSDAYGSKTRGVSFGGNGEASDGRGYSEVRYSAGSHQSASAMTAEKPKSGSPPRYPITSAARMGGAPPKGTTSLLYSSPYLSVDSSVGAGVRSSTNGKPLVRPNSSSMGTKTRVVGAAGRYG